MIRAAALLVSLFAALTVSAQSFIEQHTETCPATGQTDLVIRNVVGSVTITSWDEPEIHVDWALKSYTRKGLNGAWVEMNPASHVVEFRTSYPIVREANLKARELKNGPDSVDYIVHVPRALHSVEIATQDGDVKISGLRSDVKVFSKNGTVSISDVAGNMEVSTLQASQFIRLGKVSGNRSIHLASINGSIRLSLSRASDVSFLGSSASGGLSNEFGWIPTKAPYESTRDLQGRLGSGQASVHVEEVNGSIRLMAESDHP